MLGEAGPEALGAPECLEGRVKALQWSRSVADYTLCGFPVLFGKMTLQL